MKLLIISTADITKEFIKAFESVKTSEDEVVGVYSRSIDKAKDFSEQYNIKNYFDDLDNALEFDGYDTVYIATPNALHYSFAKMFLESQKHVIVEKPICLKIEQYKELLDIAEKNNCYIFDALMTMYVPNLFKLKSILEEENIQYIDFHLAKQTRHYSRYVSGEKVNVFTKAMGGGALNDLGVYLIYPFTYLFGEIKDYNIKQIKNVDGVDESTLISGKIDEQLFNLYASKVSKDDRSSIIMTTKHIIEIPNLNLIDKFIIKDINGDVINIVGEDYYKMVDEVRYFIDVVNKNVNYNKNFEQISLQSIDFLSNFN